MTSSGPAGPGAGRPERAWRLGAQAPAGFVPERIVARPDGSGLMFGWRGGPAPVDRVGVILRVYADGSLRTVWEGPGLGARRETSSTAQASPWWGTQAPSSPCYAPCL
ncbi:MAG: hypothetical protein IPI35_21140 [Deltaproteobacteria bacterium]|nr:hypothetical protein [Deltaproteobacteria bacterium]